MRRAALDDSLRLGAIGTLSWQSPGQMPRLLEFKRNIGTNPD
jgi:hypothetical protein